jgi:hypothetical protein
LIEWSPIVFLSDERRVFLRRERRPEEDRPAEVLRDAS